MGPIIAILSPYLLGKIIIIIVEYLALRYACIY